MPPRPAPHLGLLANLSLLAILGLSAILGAPEPAAASTQTAEWTPLGDAADRALGWTGRRSMRTHSQAVREHLERSPSGTWNAAREPHVETFPALDPTAYFIAAPAAGLTGRHGLTDRGRLTLGRGERLGLDVTAACGGDADCARALGDVVAATLAGPPETRLPPRHLERHFYNRPAAGTGRRGQRLAVRTFYRLTIDAALTAGHLGPDRRSRILGALETRADLPWWPSSATVLAVERPPGWTAGRDIGGQRGDPVRLAQALSETANGVMDDALPRLDLLGDTTLTLAAGGVWRDADWSEVGYGGDMASVSMIGSRAFGDGITLGLASTWEFPGVDGGGWGTGAQAATLGPFVRLVLDHGLSVRALAAFSRIDSDVWSWSDGGGAFTGERLGALTGLSYGAGAGSWEWGGWAETTWLSQTRDAFVDTLGRFNPAFAQDSVQVQVGGDLAFGGALAAVSPRLEGRYRPWAAADAVLTRQGALRVGTAGEPPPSVLGQVRLGVDVAPAGYPAVSVEGGASALGADFPSFGARAGLRLKF